MASRVLLSQRDMLVHLDFKGSIHLKQIETLLCHQEVGIHYCHLCQMLLAKLLSTKATKYSLPKTLLKINMELDYLQSL